MPPKKFPKKRKDRPYNQAAVDADIRRTLSAVLTANPFARTPKRRKTTHGNRIYFK